MFPCLVRVAGGKEFLTVAPHTAGWGAQLSILIGLGSEECVFFSAKGTPFLDTYAYQSVRLAKAAGCNHRHAQTENYSRTNTQQVSAGMERWVIRLREANEAISTHPLPFTRHLFAFDGLGVKGMDREGTVKGSHEHSQVLPPSYSLHSISSSWRSH